MSRLPVANKQEQEDEDSLQLFLFYCPITKYFYITLTKKRDGIDFDKYLTAVEGKKEGSRCVWIGCFRGISRNLSDKLAVSMNAKEMDISREDLQRLDSVDAKLNLKSHEDPQQEYQRPDFFNVNLKSGSIEDPQQFDKEKIEEMNFGESRRFTLLPDCNASRIALTLTVTDGKYTVLEKDISIDLSVSSTKPSGEKIAVENPSDDLQDRESLSEQEPLLP